MRVFCFVQAKTCRYGCMHFLAGLVLVIIIYNICIAPYNTIL